MRKPMVSHRSSERDGREEGWPARCRPSARRDDSLSLPLHPLLSSSHSLSPPVLVAVDVVPVDAVCSLPFCAACPPLRHRVVWVGADLQIGLGADLEACLTGTDRSVFAEKY
ncbi:hypothetical protein BLNAU_12343 [Blattamonas nauphoetae]|uniref:Uncharacterized protein n=1 Tax=Blattamonas nauphoetae TaxID=2049346 RepID=A0ABQ9XME5_9EUKA|nr:hypothetical protein BLNAU_12343 [Blattamonas nauphoetae]